ncbi:MAG TPA: NAD(P)/FAD-dependent oxidoreductase [Candidatus Binataceae bacterium]|nr:NAD(P)/FAD-dependent oxidoreductase [Candidatus Binataceae bacterium]
MSFYHGTIGAANPLALSRDGLRCYPLRLAMASIRKCDVLIAGAGPAGLATALFLLREHPEFAGRIVVLEKSRHPRFKVCAGGLIPKVILALAELGIPLEVPSAQVLNGDARTSAGDVDFSGGGEPLCTVIRRDDFDAMLARRAIAAGAEIAEHSRVLNVSQDAERVSVETSQGIFDAGVLVGADGSGSRVRRAIFGGGKESLGRGLMTDIPADPDTAREFAQQGYRFDFRCVGRGIRGYSWSFPCIIGGRPHLNVGIYDQRPREFGETGGEQARMLSELADAFPELQLNALTHRGMSWRAFPIRWFNANDRYADGRAILAGDAAGCDPMMGEGISCAFEHGKLAARAIARFLAGDRPALVAYDSALHSGVAGRKLRKLAFAARHFYGPHSRWFFRLAMVSRRAREIGIDWSNGAHHLDELPVSTLLARWAWSVLFRTSVR